MGRKYEAFAEAKRSQQAAPLSSLANGFVGSVAVFTREWDPAIEQLRRAIERDPNFWFDYCFLGRAYEQKGELPEAIAEFQRARELEKDNAETWSSLGHAYALSGNKTKAQKILDHLKELSRTAMSLPTTSRSFMRAWEKRIRHSPGSIKPEWSYYLAVYLATDARMDSLRSDPRFAELRRRS